MLPVPVMTYYNPTGTEARHDLGALATGRRSSLIAQPLLPIQKGGTITIPVNYKAAKGKSYTIGVTVNDKHGHVVKTSWRSFRRRNALVPVAARGPATTGRSGATAS